MFSCIFITSFSSSMYALSTESPLCSHKCREVGNFDSSAGLLVGSDSSVHSRLKNSGATQKLLNNLKEVENVLDDLSVEDIEELDSLFTNFLKRKGSKDDVKEKADEINEILDEAYNKYKDNIYQKVENNSENNVGYALSRLEEMKDESEELSSKF